MHTHAHTHTHMHTHAYTDTHLSAQQFRWLEGQQRKYSMNKKLEGKRR